MGKEALGELGVAGTRVHRHAHVGVCTCLQMYVNLSLGKWSSFSRIDRDLQNLRPQKVLKIRLLSAPRDQRITEMRGEAGRKALGTPGLRAAAT